MSEQNSASSTDGAKDQNQNVKTRSPMEIEGRTTETSDEAKSHD